MYICSENSGSIPRIPNQRQYSHLVSFYLSVVLHNTRWSRVQRTKNRLNIFFQSRDDELGDSLFKYVGRVNLISRRRQAVKLGAPWTISYVLHGFSTARKIHIF